LLALQRVLALREVVACRLVSERDLQFVVRNNVTGMLIFRNSVGCFAGQVIDLLRKNSVSHGVFVNVVNRLTHFRGFSGRKLPPYGLNFRELAGNYSSLFALYEAARRYAAAPGFWDGFARAYLRSLGPLVPPDADDRSGGRRPPVAGRLPYLTPVTG
jgi:hypothetical protein